MLVVIVNSLCAIIASLSLSSSALLRAAVYQAIFLSRTSATELVEKICAKFNFDQSTIHSIARYACMPACGLPFTLADKGLLTVEHSVQHSLPEMIVFVCNALRK